MRRKEAAHGFRNLSVYKILSGFEQPITDLKTKFDQFVNKRSSEANRKIGVCRSVWETPKMHCRGGIHASRQYNAPVLLRVSAKKYRVPGRHECLPYSKNVTCLEITKHQFAETPISKQF